MWKVFFGAFVGGMVACFTALSAERWSFHLVPTGMTYAELAATLLAAASLILAALGFFIAVLAVLGWTQFRGLVKKSATNTAKTHLDERLQGDLREHIETITRTFLTLQFEGRSFRRLVEQRVDQVIYGGAAQRASPTEDENDEEQ